MIDQAAKFYVFPDGEALELDHAPKNAREVTQAEFKRAEKAHALATLRSWIKPKDTIYCVLKHRAASGMSRTIDFFILREVTGGSVGGKTPDQLRLGDTVYYSIGNGADWRTINGRIVKAPRGSKLVQFKADEPGLCDGEPVWKDRRELTFRDTSKHVIPYSISHLMAKANGYTEDKDRDGLKVHGGGRDMGFSVVYGLGCALWPNGTDKPHGTRNGVPDSAGGYAIGHRWL